MFKLMLRAAFSLMVVSSLCQVGCSSDDKGPSAQDSCEMLAEVMCDRLVSCASELTGAKPDASAHSDCVDSITSSNGCGEAIAISDDYDECSDRIRAASCEDVWLVNDDGTLEVNDLPPVCDGVILTK